VGAKQIIVSSGRIMPNLSVIFLIHDQSQLTHYRLVDALRVPGV